MERKCATFVTEAFKKEAKEIRRDIYGNGKVVKKQDYYPAFKDGLLFSRQFTPNALANTKSKSYE